MKGIRDPDSYGNVKKYVSIMSHFYSFFDGGWSKILFFTNHT